MESKETLIDTIRNQINLDAAFWYIHAIFKTCILNSVAN